MQGTKTCISCNRFVNFIFHYGFCFTLRVDFLFDWLVLFSRQAQDKPRQTAMFYTTTWRSDFIFHYGCQNPFYFPLWLILGNHSVLHYGYFSAMFSTRPCFPLPPVFHYGAWARGRHWARVDASRHGMARLDLASPKELFLSP